MQGFYAALSYVWGEPQPHSTCTAKLPTYLESLDVLLLPQTIKDAIVCTHNLKLRYLWADSLCILQDSDEDKQRELPQMCDIYRDAYVTIIAASSQKVSEGFLHDRKRPVETPLPFWCPDGRLGSISVDEDTSATPSNEPVNHRAWCFQERVLSPRTLVYASHTLQYQCQAAMNDIGDIWHYLPSTELGELRLPDMMMSRTPYTTLSNDDVRALLAAWEDVLRDYTQRAVSHPSDRLVAISGIAQLFQRWWGSSNRYIAGLWERNLSTDFLWYRSRPSNGRLITGQYLAPSWSWAATIGRVVAGSDRKSRVGKTVWDVLSCEAVPVSDDHPLGQVKGGKLTVRTVVKDVTWDYEKAELFELKQPYISVAKICDTLPGERDAGELEIAPAPVTEIVDTAIGAGLAIKEEQIKKTNHSSSKLTPVSPVEHAGTQTRKNDMGLKPIDIGRSFIANLFSKLMPCLRPRKNTHATSIDEYAPANRPVSLSETTGNDATNANYIQAEVMSPDVHDHSINGVIAVASTEGSGTIDIITLTCEREPPDHIGPIDLPRMCQSSEVAVSSKVQERHIGYVYLDYDIENDQGVGTDKGKAVIIGSDNGENPGHLTGLIVVPAGSAGEFRRVGMFHVDGRFYEDDEAPYCDIKSWLNTPTEVITIV
jgi:hypothetical protein